MSERIEGPGVALRRARVEDVPFLLDLVHDPEVEPFVSPARARDPGQLLALIERSALAPADAGRFVVEAEGPAGALAFEAVSRLSRIAALSGVMVVPSARGRGVGVAATRLLCEHLLSELDYHRVQLECYANNERAICAFERAGFRREGVRRRAYWRHGRWNDGVLMGLLPEDLG